jgi:hypothetical protein
MKTITEFPSMSLKTAAKAKQDLVTSGKTSEELPAALGEALKLEGTRLEFLVAILDIVGTKWTDLKRAIVYAPNEGEKAPVGLLQKGDHFYLVEYFPSLTQPGKPGSPADPRHKDGKGDGKRRGKGGRNEGRGGESRGNENKGPGFKRPDAQIIAPPAGTRPDNARGPRNPRGPRLPRAIPVAVVNTGAPVIIKPVTPIEAKATVETPAAETTTET